MRTDSAPPATIDLTSGVGSPSTGAPGAADFLPACASAPATVAAPAGGLSSLVRRVIASSARRIIPGRGSGTSAAAGPPSSALASSMSASPLRALPAMRAAGDLAGELAAAAATPRGYSGDPRERDGVVLRIADAGDTGDAGAPPPRAPGDRPSGALFSAPPRPGDSSPRRSARRTTARAASVGDGSGAFGPGLHAPPRAAAGDGVRDLDAGARSAGLPLLVPALAPLAARSGDLNRASSTDGGVRMATALLGVGTRSREDFDPDVDPPLRPSVASACAARACCRAPPKPKASRPE